MLPAASSTRSALSCRRQIAGRRLYRRRRPLPLLAALRRARASRAKSARGRVVRRVGLAVAQRALEAAHRDAAVVKEEAAGEGPAERAADESAAARLVDGASLPSWHASSTATDAAPPMRNGRRAAWGRLEEGNLGHTSKLAEKANTPRENLANTRGTSAAVGK